LSESELADRVFIAARENPSKRGVVSHRARPAGTTSAPAEKRGLSGRDMPATKYPGLIKRTSPGLLRHRTTGGPQSRRLMRNRRRNGKLAIRTDSTQGKYGHACNFLNEKS